LQKERKERKEENPPLHLSSLSSISVFSLSLLLLLLLLLLPSFLPSLLPSVLRYIDPLLLLLFQFLLLSFLPFLRIMADQDKGRKLYNAISEGRTEEALESIKDPLTDINWSNANDDPENTPLIEACVRSNLPVIQSLMAREDLLPNKTNDYGWTPLFIACRVGREDIVRILACDERVDINKPNNFQQTPLWRACFNGKSQCVKMLLASSKMVDTLTAAAGSDINTTPAQQAKKKGKNDIAELIDAYEKNPEQIVIKLRKELKIQSIYSFSFSLLLFLQLRSVFFQAMNQDTNKPTLNEQTI